MKNDSPENICVPDIIKEAKVSLKVKDELSLETSGIKLIGLGLTTGSRVIRRFFKAYLDVYGISITQAYAMYAISEYRGHHAEYIAKKLFMSSGCLWTHIKLMKNYIEVHREPGKHFTFPALTKEGSELLMKVMPKIIEIEREIGNLLEGKDFFIKFVSVFREKMAKSTLMIDKENRRGKEKIARKERCLSKKEGS